MPVIQKREYQINGKSYYQYRLNIPTKLISSLGWDETDEIEFVIDYSNGNGNLVCKNRAKINQE